MAKNPNQIYVAPDIEQLVVDIEQGFQLSNMESIGEEKPEQDW